MNIKQLILVLLAAGTVFMGLYVINLSKEASVNKAAVSKRYGEVYSSTGWTEMRGRPNPKSMLMMQIENTVRLEVLGEEADWVNVRAPNGREGYVKKSDLRF